MKLIAVEANIGVGKSTLLPKLADEIGFTPIKEDVDDPMFTKLLKDFTDNPHDTEKRLTFQKYITETRAKLLNNIPEGNYLIERSLFSDLIFSQVNMLGMERPDGKYLSYYYDIIDALKDYPQVDAIVYLQADPKVSYERLLRRGRNAEAGTPFEYILDLHNYHEAALPQICRTYNTPLIRIDWNNFGSARDIADRLKNQDII
ncbi:deoxynucleoside kinase [Sediminitomix flava]|uniref:Deoxyadenosine/deoxycytidine kinase n=1 Tax=Sediminitomix flava TaxID=379075 RepID=A0A316A3W4_SEDFL|nr:deoxynucleoside kinase [Sediminitomix flava]PWJ44427.1 deoxyadenosine/deoxycytidine kinase [Sediminitomix flava]